MNDDGRTIRGRGTAENPKNRFESTHHEVESSEEDEEKRRPATTFLRDRSRSIIATNDSPDVGFDASVNPYRGCEHGCVYCFARPSHEYLGYSSGLDFETKILVKEDGPKLLREELSKPRWEPKTIAFSGVTDCYQPAERSLRLTRRLLAVLVDFRNPVFVLTKNRLVTRDIDLLSELAQHQAAAVYLSVTTLDADLARRMEPRTSPPAMRLDAIRSLSSAGIPAGVLVGPVIPGLTDHELPAILDAAASAGARHAGFTLLRLPYAVGDLFEAWLDRHFPDRKAKILNRVRSIRGGSRNDSNFGSRMRGSGPFADLVRTMFSTSCARNGLLPKSTSLSTAAFRRPGDRQLRFFE